MNHVDSLRDMDPQRREAQRIKLAVDGHLMGYNGRQPITLLDLSQTGAKVAFEKPPSEKAGFISWMEFETFGEVVWREGLYIGLQFDRPISYDWLLTTWERATDSDAYRHERLLKEAKEWVEG